MLWLAGPLQWRDAPGPSWNPPPGFALLDLRSLPDHAEGTSGRAVFFGDGPIPSEYALLGSGSWTDIKPTGKALAALPRRKGFAPAGDTLRDQLLSILTDGADPDGLDGPRPILPTSERRVEFHAGGQRLSRVFSLDGSTHANRVRDVLRADFAAVFADATGGRTRDPDIHRRVLDVWCQQYGVADWREFVPPNLRPHIPGRLPHATTIADDFNRSDGSLGTAAGGWSWNAVSGTWGITSNNAGKSATASTTQLARAESDLSSADQRCQIKRTSGASGWFQGPACRVNSSAATCYLCAEFGGYLYIGKLVAGTHTNLVATACAAASGDVYKLTVNGSTLTSFNNGVSLQSTTDTSITGNLRCGMVLYAAGAQAIDDFEAADLLTHYTLTAAQGSFALSGQAAALSRSRTLAAAHGSLVLSGQAAALAPGRTLAAAYGALALGGQAAGLAAVRTLTAGRGSFALAGQAATLARTRSLAAAQGSFALLGQSAGLLAARTITASVGTFTLTGQAANLFPARTLIGGSGVYSASGQSAGLTAARLLTATTGTLTIDGQAAALLPSGRVAVAGTCRRPRWAWPRVWPRLPEAWRRAFARPRWSLSRTLRYAPMSSRIDPTTLTKPAGETRRVAFDLSASPEAVAGETFSSPEILGGSGLTFGSPTVSSGTFDGIAAGKAVLVTVSGGSAGTTYDFALRVTASGGSILVVNGRIAVTDNY